MQRVVGKARQLQVGDVPAPITVIKGVFGFILAKNKGGAWGLLQSSSEKVRKPFFVVVSELIVGYLLAQLMMREFPLKGLFRTIHTLPLMVAPIAVGATWRLLTVPGLGPIPYYLERWFGIEYRIGTYPDQAFLTIMLMDIWHWTPLITLTLLAGLSALPKEPFEQAQIDGANRWQTFWHITLPLLRPVILTTVFIRLMDALRIVDEVWMLTGDKMETAENIGYSCRLIQKDFKKLYLSKEAQLEQKLEEFSTTLDQKHPGERYTIIIEGKSILSLSQNRKLAKRFVEEVFTRVDSVVCCRMSPKQKGDVVRMIKKFRDKVTLAIGDGAKQKVIDQVSAMGTNLLTVRPGAPNTRGRDAPATLVIEDVQAIAELPNVLASVPEQGATITLRAGNIDHRSSVNGTSADYVVARNWAPASGTFFSAEDEARYATVAVLGQTVARALFPGRDAVGEFILVNNIPFQVMGVMTPKGATPWGQDQDDIVFMPYTTASLRITGQRFLRNVTVAVEDVGQIDDTQAAVSALLLARHGVEDFQIRNMASVIDTVSETQNTLTVLLGTVAAISLLVGGIGVMNIMLVSVTERTREIGIRMATGARTRNILQQFLIEALVVSAVGGLIGVAAGLGAAAIIEAFGTAVQYSLTPVVLAFSCAFLTGLVFGYLPARKAARLDPVVALASE